jgi:hypothetical protein
MMLPTMVPNFKLADSPHDVLYEAHYSRQTLLDIILKVELADEQENLGFKVGNQLNYESSGVLKAFLPQNFLVEILDRMKEDIENQDVIDSMQKQWLHTFE